MLKVEFPEEDWKAWEEQSKSSLKNFFFEFIQNLNNAIVEATPVRLGFLQRSWFGGVGAQPDDGVAGSGGIASLNAAAAGLNVGDTFYAVNKAVYAARVEYGFIGKDKLGRSYNQQPRAFVRSTIDRAREIAQATATKMGLRIT